jgi:hypothetical protein
MHSPRPFRIRFLTAICVVACLASAVLGWTNGVYVARMYGAVSFSYNFAQVIPDRIGGWVGSCSGVIACLLWCRFIVPRSLRSVTGLRSMAGLAGLVAGVLASVILNCTLIVTAGVMQPYALAVGLGLAAPVGLLLGVIGGHFCRIAVTTERAFRLPRERRVAMYDESSAEPDYLDQLDVRSHAQPHHDFRDEYDA